MENRIFFGLLMLGEGMLAPNYIIFCFVGSLGITQFVAARYGLRGMLLLPASMSQWLGIALVVFGYIWFFTVQPDLFIPGLAGGELSTFALLGFALAVGASLLFGLVSLRVLNRARAAPPPRRERVALGTNAHAELWMPSNPFSVLILAVRESAVDSLDVLAGELVKRGAAVLLCEAGMTDAALGVMHARFETLKQVTWGAVGLGTGAGRILARGIADAPRFQNLLALAPYGKLENRRAGLRWLRETDYVNALQLTRQTIPRLPAGSRDVLVVYGDEDTLIPPTLARALFPRALMVAGAHHFDLAAQPATITLAADLFRLPALSVAAIKKPDLEAGW